MSIINRLRTIGLITVFAGVIVGCASTTQQKPATSGVSAADAIAAAKAANAKAKAAHYEWRDTGKIIKEAEKAMKGGDDATAVKLADKAERQAENAVKQKYSELERLKKEGIINDASAESAPAPAPAPATGQYDVNKGDRDRKSVV